MSLTRWWPKSAGNPHHGASDAAAAQLNRSPLLARRYGRALAPGMIGGAGDRLQRMLSAWRGIPGFYFFIFASPNARTHQLSTVTSPH